MLFWVRVKDEIRKNKTTQEWVATHIGVSLNTFKGWIAKGIMPNVDQAMAIADALETTVDYLLRGEALKVGFSDDEAEVMRLYRGLGELKPVALAQLRALAGAKAPRSASEFFGPKQGAG